MSERRSTSRRIAGSSTARRHRWVIGAVGALGASGLILGGVGLPASADDVTGGIKPHASAGVQDNCVTAAAGTGEAGGSAQPQGDGAQLQAAGEGTATVSVCLDDGGDPLPGDPGGSVPGDIDDVVPVDPDGELVGELVGIVTAALEDGVPGEGDGPLPGDPTDGLPGEPGDAVPGELEDIIPGGSGGPGGGLPGDLGDVVPGSIGGLVPDGSGIDPGGLLDRLTQVLPGAIDDGGTPGGNGGRPALNPSATGSGSGAVATGGDGANGDAPPDMVLGAELERAVPSSVETVLSPGATLPRTGGGLGTNVLRLIALLGLGRAGLGLANRWRAAVASAQPGSSEGQR